MRLCVDVPEDTAVRIKRYLLDTFHTTYKVQQPMLLEAVLEYLDRHEKKSMPPAMPEKKSEKRGKGPMPLEVRDPDLAQKIVAFYGAGKRSGGHSRSETAREFGVGEAQVDKIIRRAR